MFFSWKEISLMLNSLICIDFPMDPPLKDELSELIEKARNFDKKLQSVLALSSIQDADLEKLNEEVRVDLTMSTFS